MLRYFKRKLDYLKALGMNAKKFDDEKTSKANISHSLIKNISLFQEVFGGSSDVVFREFSFGNNGQFKACLIFADGLTDKIIINESIIKPLMYDSRIGITSDKTPLDIHNISEIKEAMITVGEVYIDKSLEILADNCLSGNTVMMVDGLDEALIISSRGWAARAVEEPKTETVVRGPREGFTETLRTNTALIRRKIRNPNLVFETMKIGTRTKTDVSIAYLKGVVNIKIVDEVKYRLSRIKIDAILESGYIEDFIEDAPFSIFPTVSNSEKPDSVAAKVLEGRIAILVEGTPFVLTVPSLFVESFQSSEDYYSRPYFASFIRLLRVLSYFITILAPALYVSLVTFNQELLPTPLLLTISAAKEGLPFPSIIEALLMIIVFEILREAGIRLPRPVGQAVSIVGALVLGESAVQAGLISPLMVIVVAITAISSFVIPSQTDSASIMRIIMVTLGGSMGIYGVAIGLLGLLIHLSSLRSFGSPYLSPVAPFTGRDMKDIFIRMPIWAMFTRPRALSWDENEREVHRLKPAPPDSQNSN